MANAIELAKSYVPKLDEVYKLARPDQCAG